MQGKANIIAGVVGIGLGTGLMFFLDPDRGARRRNAVRSQAKRTSRQLGRVMKSVDRTARDLANGANAVTKRISVWQQRALRLVA